MQLDMQVKIDRRGSSNRPVFFNQIVAVFEGWNDSRNVGARALTDSRGQVRYLIVGGVNCEAGIARRGVCAGADVMWGVSLLRIGRSTLMLKRWHLHRERSTTPASLSNGTRYVS